MNDLVLLERRGEVTVLSLNAPGHLNALTTQMVEALNEALEQATQSSRAIVLGGCGKNFCAGFNIGSDLNIADPAFDAGAVLETHVNDLILKLRASPVPIVTAIRGAAVGAGAGLALSGDLIVAGTNAYFLQAFVRIGLVPDAGVSWLLARSLTRARAMELALLGDRLEASTALIWGLVNRVVADEKVDECAMQLAEQLAAGPRHALSKTRELIWVALESSMEEQLALERHYQRDAGHSVEFIEGIAAFRQKRKPRFP